MAENITTPVGRLVQGNLYKGYDKNYDGQPLTDNKGQPRLDFYFALAIPKGAEQHWNQTPWGAIIYKIGAAAFPQAMQRKDFAWKIVDGDSTEMNRKNARPCDNIGFPGHWVLRFGGGSAPQIYKREGGKLMQFVEDGAVKIGYYAQVALSVSPNNNEKNPGVYLNHRQVLFCGFGEEIVQGLTAEEAFGDTAAALPPGASAVPLGVANPTQGSGGMLLPDNGGVVPNTAFANGPSTEAPPPPSTTMTSHSEPPPPPKQMTAKAGTTTYEQFIAKGWKDEQLIALGYMTA